MTSFIKQLKFTFTLTLALCSHTRTLLFSPLLLLINHQCRVSHACSLRGGRTLACSLFNIVSFIATLELVDLGTRFRLALDFGRLGFDRGFGLSVVLNFALGLSFSISRGLSTVVGSFCNVHSDVLFGGSSVILLIRDFGGLGVFSSLRLGVLLVGVVFGGIRGCIFLSLRGILDRGLVAVLSTGARLRLSLVSRCLSSGRNLSGGILLRSGRFVSHLNIFLSGCRLLFLSHNGLLGFGGRLRSSGL